MSIAVALLAVAVNLSQGPPILRGTVFDSVTMKSLSGANVSAVGAAGSVLGRSAATIADTTGTFRFVGLSAGEYVIGFTHRVLDSLGLDPPLSRVLISDSDVTVALTTHSRNAINGSVCASDKPSSAIYGRVTDRTGEPLDSVGVTLFVKLLRTNSVPVGLPGAETVTASSGAFVFCGLRSDSIQYLQAQRDERATGIIPVRMQRGDLVFAPLVLGEDRFDSTQGAWRGLQTVSGSVATSTGASVPGATVELIGSNVRSTTDSNGRFRLNGLPDGTQVLEVRKIGFVPKQSVVLLAGEESQVLAIQLDASAVVLETVAVVANRSLAGFEARKRTSPVAAHFLTPEELGRRNRDTPLSTLVDGFPGVKKVCSGGRCSIQMRRMSSVMNSTGMENCTPFLYVDGSRDRMAETDIDMLRAGSIAAIEIYPREAQLPAEFTTLAARRPCGVIAIWTRKPQ